MTVPPADILRSRADVSNKSYTSEVFQRIGTGLRGPIFQSYSSGQMCVLIQCYNITADVRIP